MVFTSVGFPPFPAPESNGVSLFPKQIMARLGFPFRGAPCALAVEGALYTFFDHELYVL